MIFNPSLQMSDKDPMDPLIYKYIPGVMLVFFLPYHHLAPIIGISASFLYLFFSFSHLNARGLGIRKS